MQVACYAERLGRWYACRTCSRHERVVDDRARAGGFETYLPLVGVKRQWSDRTRRVVQPLFPSYLFVRFASHDLFRVLNIRGLVEVVSCAKKPVAVLDAEIDGIRRLAASWQEDAPQPEPFVARGRRVRVSGGPFDNMIGTVIDDHRKVRVMVGVQTIGLGVSIEVDQYALQPLDDTDYLV